eukprot:1489649-Rhodomonas_salina.3
MDKSKWVENLTQSAGHSTAKAQGNSAARCRHSSVLLMHAWEQEPEGPTALTDRGEDALLTLRTQRTLDTHRLPGGGMPDRQHDTLPTQW